MLREKLRKELIALFNSSLNPAPVSTVITCSHAYEQILEYLKNNKPISETNPVWNDLEVAVVESSKRIQNKTTTLDRRVFGRRLPFGVAHKVRFYYYPTVRSDWENQIYYFLSKKGIMCKAIGKWI